MISFLKFLNSHHTRQWIFLCFVVLSVVDYSGAQGIRYEYVQTGSFPPWPACATDCGLKAALNSSTQQLCTSAFIGACMQSAAFIHIPTFCSIVAPSPCPVNQCIIPPEPEALLSWVNTVCNLSTEEQTLWNESTSQRKKDYQTLKPMSPFDKRPLCSEACSGLDLNIQSSFFNSTLFNTTKFCAELVDVGVCPEACTLVNEARKLFDWVNSTCADKGYDRESWVNMTLSKDKTWVSQWVQALLPWNWTVQALSQPATLATLGIQLTPLTSPDPYLTVLPSGPGTCNTSTAEKLGVFAAVNIVSALLLPILGRRTVVNKLTFGYFGNLGSRWWPLMGVLSAALNLFANLVNAIMIRSTPGYEMAPIGALTLLWCTRPRLAWLAVFLAAVEPEDGMYFNCAASAITSEAILQVLGAVYFGISANYARKKGFYRTGQLDPYPRGVDAHTMYAGALLWLIMSFITLFACFVCIMGLGDVIENARKMMEELKNVAASSGNMVAGPLRRWVDDSLGRRAPKWLRRILDVQQGDSTNPEPRKLTAEEIQDIQSTIMAGIIFVSFLAQWLFWAGFVKAAQEKYCPPKLAILGAIWSLFAASGTFVGSTH